MKSKMHTIQRYFIQNKMETPIQYSTFHIEPEAFQEIPHFYHRHVKTPIPYRSLLDISGVNQGYILYQIVKERTFS